MRINILPDVGFATFLVLTFYMTLTILLLNYINIFVEASNVSSWRFMQTGSQYCFFVTTVVRVLLRKNCIWGFDVRQNPNSRINIANNT